VTSGGLAAETPRELRSPPSPLEQLRAIRRMFILLSGVLDLAVVGPAVRALTRAPRSESVTIDGVSVEFLTPPRRGSTARSSPSGVCRVQRLKMTHAHRSVAQARNDSSSRSINLIVP